MKYLAIGYWMEPASNNTFTLSRPTNSDDMATVLGMLCSEASMSADVIDCILLMENGPDGHPVVKEFWRDELGELSEEDEG